MSTVEKSTEYFQDVVKALDQNNMEDLIFHRRQFHKIAPGDPAFYPDPEERLKIKKNLTELSSKFWNDNEISPKLKKFHCGPYPELEDWYQCLKQVAQEKKALLDIFQKYPQTPKSVLHFFKKYYTESEACSLNRLKVYRNKIASNKEMAKWHNTLCHELKNLVPAIYTIHGQDLILHKPRLKDKIFSKKRDSTGNGFIIFIIAWLLFKFIRQMA